MRIAETTNDIPVLLKSLVSPLIESSSPVPPRRSNLPVGLSGVIGSFYRETQLFTLRHDLLRDGSV